MKPPEDRKPDQDAVSNDGALSPDDTELIAYLDGELDPTSAAAMEDALARDPQAQARAEAYRKTFDLLEFLPKAEPDPTFTTRTLTKLQPVLAETSMGTGTAGSSSQPVVLSSTTGGIPVPGPRPRLWPELLLWTLAGILTLGLGYVAHFTARPYISPPPKDPEPTASEIAMIENLPLYIGVDDLDFLNKLDELNLFELGKMTGSAPAEETPLAQVTIEDALENPTAANRQKLLDLFKSYSLTRQQQIRQLHQQLNELEPAKRKPLIETLVHYSEWLDRLPDTERREILGAPSPANRLEAVAQLHERHWRASLPLPQQEKLRKTPDVEERLQLAKDYRDRQQAGRAEWVLAQRQWLQLSGRGPDGKPWPFSDQALAKQIDEFVKTVLGVDYRLPEPKGLALGQAVRLSRDDYLELRARRDAAEKDGYWFAYGACLLRLAEKHPSLPRPNKEGTLIVRPALIPADWNKQIPKDSKPRKIDGVVGRWPEYALELHRLANKPDSKLTPLGPCRPGEFEESFDSFLQAKLIPMLTADQKKRLNALEGKWPAYPQEVMGLAREKNLSVPGVTLPGEPKKWEKYYKIQTVKK